MTALGWEEKVKDVGVTETPKRLSTRGRNNDGVGRWSSARAGEEDDEEAEERLEVEGQVDEDEVSVEEEIAEVQALLTGFLKTRHREEWGPTRKDQIVSDHHPHTHPKPHPHYPSRNHPLHASY